jgi:hypothetical protein
MEVLFSAFGLYGPNSSNDRGRSGVHYVHVGGHLDRLTYLADLEGHIQSRQFQRCYRDT